MKISRQQEAFEKWLGTFIKLIQVSKNIPDKPDLLAYLEDFMNYPVIRENMIQAFSNFMWDMDDTIERAVYDELENLIDVIPHFADPDDINTMMIQSSLTQIVAVGGQKVEALEDKEIDDLVSDDEVDDSPLDI